MFQNMTRTVHLAQVNHRYGNNVFLPYAAGLLSAYAKSQPDLAEAYEFGEMLFLREDPDTVAARWSGADVVGLSSYIWNWEYNKALAAAIKRTNPTCLVVVGGPQTPQEPEVWNPHVDVLVHNEGEITFAQVLRERLKPSFGTVAGTTTRLGAAPPRDRLKNPDEVPSPYLTGLFDGFFDAHPDLDFHATSETHRGCPWSCSWCDWGGLVYTKINRFSDERVKAEYDWMAAHEIELVYNADANFMMLPRDDGLTDHLIDLKSRTGWPKQIRAAWAKNSSEKQYVTARKLHAAGMDKGVTLALQSLHPPTLEAVKRKNIRFDDFGALVRHYQEAGMPVYTELILAQPEETYDSFANGLGKILETGLHDGLNVYLCMVLPNSELGDPAYRKRYGIVSVGSPLLQQHSSAAADNIEERAEMVIGTDAMPRRAFVAAFTLAWAVQTFHGMGLLRHTAAWFRRTQGSYLEFYETLVRAARRRPDTILGQSLLQLEWRLLKGMAGEGWGYSDDRYGDVMWPLEEATFLDIVTGDLGLFYEQIRTHLGAPAAAVTADRDGLRTPDEFDDDVVEYAKQIVWYGRKGGKFRKE